MEVSSSLKPNTMQIVRISTTAFEEEDFHILTDLRYDQIFNSLMPVINRERDGGEKYNNDMLISSLKKDYPSSIINEHFITQITL